MTGSIARQTDLNLGITTYVNGIETNPVVIDTSTVATDTIAYVATDQNGLTATTTRTVIVDPAPEFQENHLLGSSSKQPTTTKPHPHQLTTTYHLPPPRQSRLRPLNSAAGGLRHS